MNPAQNETDTAAFGTDEWLHAFAKKLAAENGELRSEFERFLEWLPQSREREALRTEGQYLDQVTGERKYQIGEAIRNRRRHLGMKQTEIAKELGVTPALVSQWENGKTRVLVDALEPLAKVLQTTRSHLLGDAPAASSAMRHDENIEDERQRRLLLSIYDGMKPSDRDLVLQAALSIAGVNLVPVS